MTYRIYIKKYRTNDKPGFNRRTGKWGVESLVNIDIFDNTGETLYKMKEGEFIEIKDDGSFKVYSDKSMMKVMCYGNENSFYLVTNDIMSFIIVEQRKKTKTGGKGVCEVVRIRGIEEKEICTDDVYKGMEDDQGVTMKNGFI